MRNLTKTITALSLLAPVSAFPLGIGGIKLHSALNQNLDAEIALLVSPGENVSDLRVKLAPPEKFDEAGVPWNYFLSKIKFETAKAANGSTIIKISSNEALREPFLDFLVEVSWDKGNLYREFTVLVDPPVAYTQSVVPVVQKANQLEEIKPDSPEKPVVTKNKIEKPNKAEIQLNLASAGQYGPTKRNDSLWKVAERTNTYSDVTREQMMVAIYEANPKAFFKPNVNALKAGKTLNIPEKEVILKLSKKEAQLAFKQQTDEWTGLVNAKIKKKTLTQQSASYGSEGVSTQLELRAPTEAEIAETAHVVLEDDVSADTGDKSTSEQAAVSVDDNNFALLARMEKLEQQLAMMQKMLTLKDEQIAVLQNKQKLADASEFSDEAELENELGKSSEEITESTDEKAAEIEAEPVVKVEPTDEAKSEPALTTEDAKEKPEVEPESEGISLPMISAILIPVLGLLGWVLWRKRKEEEETETNNESMFATASEIIPPDSPGDEGSISATDQASSLGVEMDDSNFLSEFASSDFHSFDKEPSEEVDPVLEADVYLAYGRYQQAEELMRQAIIDQPERDECKLKLLEIFHANENKSAFEEYVTELEKSGKNKDQKFWSKVVEMSDELDLKSSATTLRDGKAGEKARFSIDDFDDTVKSDEVNIAESGISDDLASNSETLQDDLESLEAEAKNDKEMEFDLSIFDEDKDEKDLDLEMDLDLDSADKTHNSGIDFDLNELDLDKPNNSSAEQKKSSGNEENIESFEFDLNELDLDKPNNSSAEQEKASGNEENIESFEFDLDSIDLDASKTGSQAKDGGAKADEIESFDFDFDAKPEKDLEQGGSDLTDMDEMETKIDLAKAYIDMGDYDAAKAIAEEAFEKGNEEQKKAAQDILDLLG